jgi:hypothetical protein
MKNSLPPEITAVIHDGDPIVAMISLRSFSCANWCSAQHGGGVLFVIQVNSKQPRVHLDYYRKASQLVAATNTTNSNPAATLIF